MSMNGGAAAVLFVITAMTMSLMGVGVFHQSWITGIRCDEFGNITLPVCCKRNPGYTCGNYFGVNNVDTSAGGLAVAGWLISLVICLSFFMSGWCWCSDFRFTEIVKPKKLHQCFGTCGGFLVLFTPVAGILGLAASLMVITEFKGAPFGIALYLCLAGSALELVFTIGLLVYICYKRREYISELRSKKYGGQGNETSGGTEFMVCCQSANVFLVSGDVSDADDDDGVEY